MWCSKLKRKKRRKNYLNLFLKTTINKKVTLNAPHPYQILLMTTLAKLDFLGRPTWCNWLRQVGPDSWDNHKTLQTDLTNATCAGNKAIQQANLSTTASLLNNHVLIDTWQMNNISVLQLINRPSVARTFFFFFKQYHHI